MILHVRSWTGLEKRLYVADLIIATIILSIPKKFDARDFLLRLPRHCGNHSFAGSLRGVLGLPFPRRITYEIAFEFQGDGQQYAAPVVNKVLSLSG